MCVCVCVCVGCKQKRRHSQAQRWERQQKSDLDFVCWHVSVTGLYALRAAQSTQQLLVRAGSCSSRGRVTNQLICVWRTVETQLVQDGRRDARQWLRSARAGT